MLQLIEEEWKDSVIDKKAQEYMWDEMAKEYREFDIPTFANNFFLQLLEKKGWLTKEMEVLDIGCGTARYDVALSDKVRYIIGVDLSKKMVSYGKEALKARRISNVALYTAAWDSEEAGKLPGMGQYDLVFAHMTPAICSYRTFMKMYMAGRKYFAFVQPTRRKNAILEEIERTVLSRGRKQEAGMQIPYVFACLWKEGQEPELYYENQKWERAVAIEAAYDQYVRRLQTTVKITEEGKKKILEILEERAVNGIVHDVTYTTVVTVLWEKK